LAHAPGHSAAIAELHKWLTDPDRKHRTAQRVIDLSA
jgi:hypothetical protein